jgi:hypothetical protein
MVSLPKTIHDGWRRCRHGGCGRTIFSGWRLDLKGVLVAGVLVAALGCTRNFYRKQANKEVGEILAEKDKYPAWAIENWHLYPDPRARFATPVDPDHPPKPPDDPAAYDLSPNPQKPGKRGVARIEGNGYLELIAQWDQENRQKLAEEEAKEQREKTEPPPPAEEQPRKAEPAAAPEEQSTEEESQVGPIRPLTEQGPGAGAAENKAILGATAPTEKVAEAVPRTSLDITGRPAYLMTLDQAAELAMFNSREYQDQRESLYLAALPVTLERFALTAQLFAAEQGIREYFGRTSTAGPHANRWALNSGMGVGKILPTGALLLFNFANQTVFDFLNPKKTISTSTLTFDAIQPLLRGGGRAVALELLTRPSVPCSTRFATTPAFARSCTSKSPATTAAAFPARPFSRRASCPPAVAAAAGAAAAAA